jgi:lipopolysaccharide assembly outer membrane protein LptD (OstA)
MFAAAMFVASSALLLPQVTPDPLKHLTTATIDGARGGARLSAVDIERDIPYPSTVHLKGSVEVKVAAFTLRAEEADYNEKTGEIDAHGDVKVTPTAQPILRRQAQFGIK